MIQIGKWIECDDGVFVNLELVDALVPGDGKIFVLAALHSNPRIITTKTPEALCRTILRKISDKRYADGDLEK